MSDSRVVDHLEDELCKKPDLFINAMLDVLGEDRCFFLAAAALTSTEIPLQSEKYDQFRLVLENDRKQVLDYYIAENSDRAERELRQMDADNAADARGDEMRDAA